MNLPNDVYRICPGKELADVSLFITIAMVVATLNVSKAHDESGKEINPVYTMSEGAIRFAGSSSFKRYIDYWNCVFCLCSHPERFECKIEPRSTRAKNLISSAVEEEYSTTNDATYLEERVRKEYASV